MTEDEKKEIIEAVIRGVQEALSTVLHDTHEETSKFFLDGKEITLPESNQ